MNRPPGYPVIALYFSRPSTIACTLSFRGRWSRFILSLRVTSSAT
jgi:hypothetical protein